MFNYRTLSIYLSITYLKYFITTTLVVICFIVLAGIFEVLQDFKNYTLSFHIFVQLILLKIPFFINEIAPTLSFVSMLFFLKALNKNNELLIIIGNGISFGRILIIPAIISVVLGIIFLVVISPLSTFGLNKLERLENKITKKKPSGFAFLTSNILFFEEYQEENRIVKAQSLNVETKQLNNAMVLILNQQNALVKRIDSEKIIIENDNFKLINPKVIFGDDNKLEDELNLPTRLSIDNLTKRYLLPQKIYIWDLPQIIVKFSQSGLPTLDYKVFYYKQLCKPIYMAAMIIVASCFLKLNNNRSNMQAILLSSGLFSGVMLYACLEITIKLLISNGITPIWAILLPIFLIMVLGNFVILHLY